MKQERNDFKMLDIAFVVLHYNTFSTTCECVDSIKMNIDSKNYKIVVVDNYSQNNTFFRLKEYYKDDLNVIVLQTNKNLGFANGNNFGINYIRNNFKFKFLCCCNNDILLYQKDFFLKLNLIKIDDIAVIAPKVFKADGSIQTYNCFLKDKGYYEKLLKKSYFYKKHKNIVLIRKKIAKIYKFITRKKQDTTFFNDSHFNIILHGCCLIFTNVFFENYDGFNTKTFLYREEEILYNMVTRKGLKTFYNPNIYITHLEDVSTDSVVITNKKKIDFIYKNQIDSLKILIGEMSNE